MKRIMYVKKWWAGTRMLLLSIAITCCLPIMAYDGWVMVFHNAYGEEQQIPMTKVGSLVAVDDAYDFTILSTTGDILAEGVLKVSFKLCETMGIKPIKPSDNIIARSASDKLTLIGVKGDVAIYNSAGSLQTRVTATGGATVISIAFLPSGIYIVKVGNQTFKFIKK